MFERNVETEQKKIRVELNFQISKLDFRFKINLNGFLRDRSFEHNSRICNDRDESLEENKVKAICNCLEAQPHCTVVVAENIVKAI